ncbi:hypothetical protein BMR05_16420, partial [Methylococcaceae bacterium HT4]
IADNVGKWDLCDKTGKVYAAGEIYALNLRSGLLRFLCLVTSGTQRHQEIPVLRDHIEKQNKGNNSSQKHLYVYDKAVTDFVWWDRQKRHANYMISMLKENSIATLVESIPFDSQHEINTGVEAYSVYENKGIKFNVVDYRDPETGKLHRFVTTLPMTINPGTIAMLYFKSNDGRLKRHSITLKVISRKLKLGLPIPAHLKIKCA